MIKAAERIQVSLLRLPFLLLGRPSHSGRLHPSHLPNSSGAEKLGESAVVPMAVASQCPVKPKLVVRQ